MACAHNVIIRGLNAVYLQACHVPPEQQASFLNFAEFWFKVIENHHNIEETVFFPVLEEMTGDKNVMKVNHDQHEEFQEDLAAYLGYIKKCQAGEVQYDGKELLRLIDGFGPVLWQHLHDEIPTFTDLKRYGDKLKGFFARLNSEAEKESQELGILAGAVYIMATHDVEFEGGIHTQFPPIPAAITWGLRNVAWWAHSDWWVFAPCDRQGKMRPLPAVGA